MAGAEGNIGRFLLEDWCVALTREMTELKELAREATEGATEHVEEAWESLAGVVNKAVRAAQEGGVEARGDGGVRAVGHGGEWPARSKTKVVPLGRLVSIGQATQRRLGRFAISTSSIVFHTMMKEIATKTKSL